MLSRGLIIKDESACADFLAVTSYYQFSGYARYFQKAPHLGDNNFRPGSTFDEIRAVYDADEALRTALFRPLTKIELMLRSHVARVIADEYGGYGRYMEEDFYTDRHDCERTVESCLRDIDRSRDRHILHYRDDDGDRTGYSALPVWSAVEAWSFGTLSKVIERRAQGPWPAPSPQAPGIALRATIQQSRVQPRA
jgi:abortive infection bacteriophage resistance protein